MAKGFNPKDYSTVETRLEEYREDNPDYRVETEVTYFSDNADVVIVKATIYKNADDVERGVFHSTGIAEETRGAGYVNKTSHVENCETSAIGRALANVGYTGGGKRPSLEEMEKTERTKKAQAKKIQDEVTDKVEKGKDVTEKAEEKEKEANKDDGGDYQKKIDSFESLEELLEWFNGNEDPDFKEKWFGAVQKKIAELRP